MQEAKFEAIDHEIINGNGNAIGVAWRCSLRENARTPIALKIGRLCTSAAFEGSAIFATPGRKIIEAIDRITRSIAQNNGSASVRQCRQRKLRDGIIAGPL